MNTQAIPSSASYLANLPCGRDIHSPPGPYVPPRLDPEQIAKMQAPPEQEHHLDDVESSGDEDEKSSDRMYY